MTNQPPPAIRRMPRPEDVARLTTDELRSAFLVPGLYAPGKIQPQFTDLDRLVGGGAVPTSSGPLALPGHRETGCGFFLERRELGAINTGGPGTVTVDGQLYPVETEGCLYVGMGGREVQFASRDAQHPAKYFILSQAGRIDGWINNAGLTKALANEWARERINVNAIAPGYIATDNTQALRNDPHHNRTILDRIPEGRWGSPEDIAGAILFLASSDADYVNGTILNVDGGWLAR